MARTPLLRALRRVFRDAHFGRKNNVPLAQVAEQRAAQKSAVKPEQLRLTRRELTMGVAALASPIPWLAPPAAAARQPRVAIVGGGIAGLTCALTLADRGISSTVYEASGRLGGRMFSNDNYFEGGQVTEWFGELIDSGHTTIRGLAKRFRLELDDLHGAEPAGSEDTYFLSAYYTADQATQDFVADVAERVAADAEAAGYPTSFDSFTAEGAELDAMSVYEWIESRVPGGHDSELGQLLDLAYATEYGADTHDQSALNLVYLLGYQPDEAGFSVFGESDEAFRIRGGNQQLPLAIANALPCIELGHTLERVKRTAAGAYSLDFRRASGSTRVTADYVVLALPFAVLRGVDLSKANFDALKMQAIAEQGAGRNAKIQLQFKERLWNKAGAWPGVSNGSSYSDTGYQSSWESTRGQAGRRGILVFYSGGSVTGSLSGSQAVATVADKRVAADVKMTLRQAEGVFPGLTEAWNGRATESIPHLSPLYRSSYAYYRPGQYLQFAGYESVRQGGVFFCGEHTSTDFQGYMEGGASEGKRAARQLSRLIRNSAVSDVP